MARIFTTCLYVVLVLTAVGVIFTFLAKSLEIEKAVFNYNVSLVPAWFVLSMVFVQQMKAKGHPLFTPFNLNVVIAVTCGVLMASFALINLATASAITAEGAGVLIGSAFSALATGGTSLAMALARRDNDPDE